MFKKLQNPIQQNLFVNIPMFWDFDNGSNDFDEIGEYGGFWGQKIDTFHFWETAFFLSKPGHSGNIFLCEQIKEYFIVHSWIQ